MLPLKQTIPNNPKLDQLVGLAHCMVYTSGQQMHFMFDKVMSHALQHVSLWPFTYTLQLAGKVQTCACTHLSITKDSLLTGMYTCLYFPLRTLKNVVKFADDDCCTSTSIIRWMNRMHGSKLRRTDMNVKWIDKANFWYSRHWYLQPSHCCPKGILYPWSIYRLKIQYMQQ